MCVSCGIGTKRGRGAVEVMNLLSDGRETGVKNEQLRKWKIYNK